MSLSTSAAPAPVLCDFNLLLEPVSDAQPAGIDVRDDAEWSSSYNTIKDARHQARAIERNSLIDDPDYSEADAHWTIVRDQAPALLQVTKDLEILGWYTEAVLRKDGLPGLLDCFRLFNHFISQFWGLLYPLPDEDGIETTVAPLTGLNGESGDGVLIVPLRMTAFTPDSTDVGYSFWQYQQALENSRISDEEHRMSSEQKLGYSLDDIQQIVNQGPADHYLYFNDVITACLSIYRELSSKLDEHCGYDVSPPVSNIIQSLESQQATIKHLAASFLQNHDETGSSDTNTDHYSVINTDDSLNQPDSPVAVVSSEINDRDQALEQLIEIAEFFRKTEPHSPLSYTLEKIVRWGNMSLIDLMQELIPDSSSREHYGELTGVKNEDD